MLSLCNETWTSEYVHLVAAAAEGVTVTCAGTYAAAVVAANCILSVALIAPSPSEDLSSELFIRPID